MTYMLDLRLFQAFCICDRCGLKVRVTTDRPPDSWAERAHGDELRHYCADHPFPAWAAAPTASDEGGTDWTSVRSPNADRSCGRRSRSARACWRSGVERSFEETIAGIADAHRRAWRR